MDSKPYLSQFDPTVIPYQYQVIQDIRKNFDYGIGNHEILLSGSYGSAKSTLMAHIAVTHCLFNPGARVCLARKARPDLKRTIFKEIISHIANDLGSHQYSHNETSASITFSNGSEIISSSCSDKKYTKVRSLQLSMVVIEELIELNSEDKEFFMELKARLRRIPGIVENILLAASNPDSPSHWAYEYFIESTLPTRHVYYSNTFDNPFLDKMYIEQLKTDLDPKMAQRYIYGKWIEITTEVIYHAYDQSRNYVDNNYAVDVSYPIHISFDFNIGEGKPLSAVFFQFVDDKMHIFDEIVIEGMRTEGACDEMAGRGLLDHETEYIINGDATGRSRDTRNVRSDYDIIKNYFSNYKQNDKEYVKFKLDVPLSNPPIRKRHNMVNAYCRNDLGQTRLFVYKKAKTADKGLRLSQLRKGGQYIEDDSKEYQHITTAIGYGLLAVNKKQGFRKQTTILL